MIALQGFAGRRGPTCQPEAHTVVLVVLVVVPRVTGVSAAARAWDFDIVPSTQKCTDDDQCQCHWHPGVAAALVPLGPGVTADPGPGRGEPQAA
eukprot:1596707-Rhodomonas_salina.3